MKILGIGVDMVKNQRINILIKNNNFINRTFTKNEILFSKKIKIKLIFLQKDLQQKSLFLNL